MADVGESSGISEECQLSGRRKRSRENMAEKTYEEQQKEKKATSCI